MRPFISSPHAGSDPLWEPRGGPSGWGGQTGPLTWVPGVPCCPGGPGSPWGPWKQAARQGSEGNGDRTNRAGELSPRRNRRGGKCRKLEGVRGAKGGDLGRDAEGGGSGGVSTPITYQAAFGTVGAIHASDSLKHERGLSPGRTCGFPRQAIPTGWGRRAAAALQFIPNLSNHGRPDPQGMGLWSVGLFCFVLFLLRTFFLLCPKCLMH